MLAISLLKLKLLRLTLLTGFVGLLKIRLLTVSLIGGLCCTSIMSITIGTKMLQCVLATCLLCAGHIAGANRASVRNGARADVGRRAEAMNAN